ncbi:amidase domain-containing protein [Mesobacillus harenae]|uniref:amidase domain-containing protein n=1 Tax=Mesobacillus harenae TaxID=2213203 RepID=UPI001580E48E|nr:amidase domain-containing protein [Mesobacillus harenae]
MRKQLQHLLEERVQQCVSDKRNPVHHCKVIEQKKESNSKRSAEIVKAKAIGKINSKMEGEEFTEVFYSVHYQYLIKQKNQMYIEEEVEKRKAKFYKGVLVEDFHVYPQSLDSLKTTSEDREGGEELEERQSYRYDRLKAVRYAERWWNDYNPAYKQFDVDCTNYISQCLHSGGAPMLGYPNRSKGWWMRSDNWSFSWSVANSMRWYLPGAKTGLRAREVGSPEELLLGDVICYDFQGDGRFDHTTIVTGKDGNGMPLVNAHTTNSRMRYWAYEDSTAYTTNIKYKFLTIVDDQKDGAKK